MLSSLFSDPFTLLITLISLVIAIDIHEFSHAWMAERLGDPTARLMGRLTLNPLAHLDPLGTLSMFLFRFGWGKPVPFDPFNLADPRRDGALISLAGPVSNLILATILSVVIKLLALTPLGPVSYLLLPVIELNVVLAVFNLLPVHPLDGGKIIAGILPEDLAGQWDMILNQYGTVLLILLILPLVGGMSLASVIISPIINLVLRLLLGGAMMF